MLRNESHVRDRNSVNPYHRWPGLEDPQLSWPGYLGADVKPGQGVLAIANVHRDFRSDGMAGDPGGLVDRLVAGSRKLKAEALSVLTDASVESYLDATRPAYMAGLGPRGWNVGRNLQPVYDAFHLIDDEANLRRLTFANVSCGQFPEGRFDAPWTIDSSKSGNAKTKMKTRCARANAHPIHALLEIVQPEIVLCMSAKAWAGLAGYRDRYKVVYVHQWRGRDLLGSVTLDGQRLEKGTKDSVWLPLLSRHVVHHTSLH